MSDTATIIAIDPSLTRIRNDEVGAIADHVRETVPWADVEAGLRRALGGAS
jgi:hypothetical protein